LGLKNIQYGIANTQTADVQQRIFLNATLESGLASWEIGMWFLYTRPVTRVNFDNIDCPVLVLGGEEDKVTPIRIQKAIADRLGDRAALVCLPSVCHWTVADGHLPIVSQAILNWIQTHE